MKAPLSGGAAVTVLSGDSTPQFVAVDDTSLYWTDARETPAYAHGAVMKNAKK